MPVELRHLRYFHFLAEELHFSRAARRANTTQPGLSQQIRRLEEVMGVRLFDRDRRNVRLTRAGEIFWPYHERIEAELDRRQRTGRPVAMISLHSFTPVYKGAKRPWHAGVLYNRDARLAHRLMTLLNAEEGLFVGDNAPYFVSDTSDYTIPVHAERRGLRYVLVEIRQDLIGDEAGQRAWALRLARLLPLAYRGL